MSEQTLRTELEDVATLDDIDVAAWAERHEVDPQAVERVRRHQAEARRTCGWALEKDARRRLSAGADVNAADAQGNTPLMEAVRWEGVESVRLLIDSGANVHAHDTQGATAIIEAVAGGQHGHVDIVRILIDAGADVHVRNNRGHDALMMLVKHARRWDEDDCAAVVRTLIDAGADGTAQDHEGTSALQAAKDAGHNAIVAEIERGVLAAAATSETPGSAPKRRTM
ncbi:ankyrin repeat domain-containing protein [Dyella psychrodurans]|uniref:Ankyrin repeat domain-containing protein n=1 Tax=Dyella psychrodurans TaxID=1927960 RepID=A0A370XCH2_9GAMM|nr:ankyrin repeat domain-containing protein [Dyella psychrodurans]RDS85921.1 ankyrin repeat domain-containing protein [Dyella psychrodurans]